jgi:hypothetical protein
MSPRIPNILDRPILSLSDSDVLYGRDFFQGGVLIVGDPGSGKSSTSLKQITCSLLRAGLGCVFLTVKSEDTANYLAMARECGRSGDVRVLSEDSQMTFDPLAYEASRLSGKGAGFVEATVDYISTLMSIGKPPGGGEARFWELSAEQITRGSVILLKLAGELPSIVNVSKAITSFPTYPGQQDDELWLAGSYTASLIERIRERRSTLTEDEWQDLETATDLAFGQWAGLDPKTRGSIEMTLSGLIDRFKYNPLRRIFASGTYSWTPEQVTHEGLILIVDFSVSEYGRESAPLISTMVKLTCQRAWLRHKYVPGCCRGAFIVQDEFQLLMSKFESFFSQTCRGSAVTTLCATQSILGLAEVMGESQPGSKTKGFLSNLGLKIAHRTTCPDTANYFADVIGKEYRYMENFSAGSGHEPGSGHTNVGGSRQLVHIVDPIEFTRLERPDSSNPRATAIIYRGGDIFNATKTERNPQGCNYLRVSFTR